MLAFIARAGEGRAAPPCTSFEACIAACEAGDATSCDRFRAAMMAACDRKDALACGLLGTMHETGDSSTPVSVDASADYYQRACDLGHGPSCNNWGFALVYGQGVALDDAKGVAAWKRGCSLDDALSCGNYGGRLLHGRGVARDDAEAGVVLAKSCRLQSDVGCYHYGNWHEQQGSRKDALAAWTTACALKHDDACRALDASGVPRPAGAPTAVESHATHVKECEANQPIACAMVAADFRYGRGVPQDQEAANSFDVRACTSAYPHSCVTLGQLSADRGELVEAEQYFLRACDLGQFAACAEAGFVRRTLGKTPGARTPISLFDLGCKHNNAASCFGLGGELEAGKQTRPTKSRTLAAYERACDGRHGQACAAAARLARGKKAAALRARACKLGVKHSCSTVSAKPK